MRRFAVGLSIATLALNGAACTTTLDVELRLAGAFYFSPDDIDLSEIIPLPPKTYSEAELRELNEMENVQASRGPGTCAKAQADERIDSQYFADALGLVGTRKISSLPKLRNLLIRIHFLEATIVGRAKKGYRRLRPYQVDSNLRPCISMPTDASYPSGHAAWAYMTANVLSDMVPERRDSLLQDAGSFSRSRVVGGVHYPSDVEAGKSVGEAIARKLKSSLSFRLEAQAARQELREALQLPIL